MRFRLAMPEGLIDLDQLTDLWFISLSDTHLAVGAITRASALE